MLCLYWDISPCFSVQKALYFSRTACAAAPLFTLCLKPEPSLLKAQMLHSDVTMLQNKTKESNGGVSGRGGVCGRETPSGGNLAFADHTQQQH